MARRLSPKTQRRLPPLARQMELDGEIADARLAAVPHLDQWRQQREATARARHAELASQRRLCQGKDGCRQVAVIWIVNWSTAQPGASFCLGHWPSGEGRALQSALGWLPQGRPLADTGWRADGSWGPAGEHSPSVHTARGIGLEVRE